jgi:hypothetical protein
MEAGGAGAGTLHPDDLPRHAPVRGTANLPLPEHGLELEAIHDVGIPPAAVFGQVVDPIKFKSRRQHYRAHVKGVGGRFQGFRFQGFRFQAGRT